MTVADAAAAATRVLTEAGFSGADARTDVSVLARHVLGWTPASWIARAHEPAPPRFSETLASLATRRATHEPVAYITGVREFYGRPFRVTPAVLIPRPETELIVDEAIATGTTGTNIADVGTGSGCLAVTLALELPGARVVATDISAAALEVARSNARDLAAGAVEFVETSLLPPGTFDLIVSNPPYVPERDRAALSADVREFEPASALFGGEDGLDVIRALVPSAARALRPGGRLLLEIGAGQADDVAAIVRSAGLELTGVRHDLQQIARVVVARQTG